MPNPPEPNSPLDPTSAAPTPSSAVRSVSRRERGARWALASGAGALLLLALVHGTGYVTASIAVSNSGLSMFYQDAFRALWLGFSMQAAVLALVLGLAAFRPAAVSRAVVGICGLLPVLNAAVMLRFVGGETTGWLLAATALLILVGMTLQPARSRSEQ